MHHKIHKYERTKLGKKYIIFRCMIPNCSHYIPESLIKGRISICWRCGEQFVIDREAAELARPHCKDCTKPKEVPDAFTDALGKLINLEDVDKKGDEDENKTSGNQR